MTELETIHGFSLKACGERNIVSSKLHVFLIIFVSETISRLAVVLSFKKRESMEGLAHEADIRANLAIANTRYDIGFLRALSRSGILRLKLS